MHCVRDWMKVRKSIAVRCRSRVRRRMSITSTFLISSRVNLVSRGLVTPVS